MCGMLLRFNYTAIRAQPDPWSYHLGSYGKSSRVIFKDIAFFCIFFTLCVRLNFADFFMESKATISTVNQPAFTSG